MSAYNHVCMLACEKEIIYPQDSSYDIIPIETILSNFMSLWGGWFHKKLMSATEERSDSFWGKFIFICSITNLSYIAYMNSHSKTTFVALYISLNVLCYAFSLHLSDTLLLARLNLSRISMAAKFESLNLKIFSQQNNFSSIKTNEWISSKLMSSSWTCSHNENANDDIDCLHICVRLLITIVPEFNRDSIKINIDTKFQIYFQLEYEILLDVRTKSFKVLR